MKTLSASLLLCAAASLAALEVHPDPGLALSPAGFTDLRFLAGTAASVTSASAPGASVGADSKLAPHVAVQLVRGWADDSTGLALGVEYAYDNSLGRISSFSGSNITYGGNGGLVALRSHSLNLLPKAVLRPSLEDPFDGGPSSVQVEIGPVLGAGLGWAHVGDSGRSDQALVWRYGARLALVVSGLNRWQGGFELGWEAFVCDPAWQHTHGSLSGSGLEAALFLGRRL